MAVMFKDIKMSEDSMIEFKQTHFSKKLSVDMNVKILTTGNWPNDNKETLQVILP